MSVTKTPHVDYVDLEYPSTIPEIPVVDLESNQATSLNQMIDPNYPFLVIRSTPACRPCIISFQKYISRIESKSADTKSITKVFFFPETTDITNIVKYTELVKPEYNFKFVKGKLADLESIYGLIVLPDGVLFDENGRFSKNHITLSNL